MGKTLQQIRTTTRRHLDEITSTDTWTNDELDDYINASQRWLLSEILKIYPDYKLKVATTTVVQGQADYTMPTDMYGNKIKALYLYETATSTVYKLEMRDSDKIAMESYRQSRPKWYTIVEDAFRLAPLPDNSTWTLEIWYIKQPTDMTLDTDTSDFSGKEDDIIALWAAYKALLRAGYQEDAAAIADTVAVELGQLSFDMVPEDKLNMNFEPLDVI